ncbi:MAG: Crp/Fnr family transcriptional regulator [Dehalococcoidia bacterium]|nr:Crp/Fnr family transcriptional regulator [Dehalococcoidia bacterium]
MFKLANPFSRGSRSPQGSSSELEHSIADIPLLAALTSSHRRSLRQASRLRSYLPGEVILLRVQPVGEVSFVVNGQVVHEVKDLRSQRLTLGESGVGTIIGTSAFTDQPVAQLTARALTSLTCLACDVKTLRSMVVTSPKALRLLLHIIADRRRRTVSMLVEAVQDLI